MKGIRSRALLSLQPLKPICPRLGELPGEPTTRDLSDSNSSLRLWLDSCPETGLDGGLMHLLAEAGRSRPLELFLPLLEFAERDEVGLTSDSLLKRLRS